MQLLREDVEGMLKKAKLDIAGLEKPPKPEMGDLAFPCFSLAKERRKAPAAIASEIVSGMKPSGNILKVEAFGPYVNFYADWGKLGGDVLLDALATGGKYGAGAAKKKTMMVEFSHPNTHKAFHIGHTRNIILGESLSRVLSFAGYKVARVNYQGDIGPHVARCIWGLSHLDLKEPAEKEAKGRWLGEVYAKASMAAKDSEKAEGEIKEINKKLYAGDPELVKLWKKTRQWSLDYFDGIYADFGAKFDRFYFESEVEGPGIKLARKLEKEGIAKMSDGAIVMDLERHGLGIFVLLTQDGTPLYSIKDFILAGLQDKEYGPERIVHVVGSEQDLHFQQLIKSLEQTNPSVAKKEYHMSYGLVNLPTGKMKSREGQVILYEDLKERVVAEARKVTAGKNPKLSEKELSAIAGKVGMGALKYDMVKISPEKTIVFDWDRALSFEGNNAPYLQYTHARCCSIIAKAGKEMAGAGSVRKCDPSLLKDEKEIAVIRKLSEFPELVQKAAREMRPHYVATYAYELCDAFNEFYQFVPVLKASNKKIVQARIALVSAARVTISNALGLLGIEAPEKM
jgi:arginyl-tRNA synthetase